MNVYIISLLSIWFWIALTTSRKTVGKLFGIKRWKDQNPGKKSVTQSTQPLLWTKCRCRNNNCTHISYGNRWSRAVSKREDQSSNTSETEFLTLFLTFSTTFFTEEWFLWVSHKNISMRCKQTLNFWKTWKKSCHCKTKRPYWTWCTYWRQWS